MILRPHEKFKTEADTAQIEEYKKLQAEINDRLNKNYRDIILGLNPILSSNEEKKLVEQWEHAQDEIYTIEAAIKARYIQSFEGDYNSIIADTKRIVEAITYEDFAAHIDNMKRLAGHLSEKRKNDTHILESQENTAANCYSFIYTRLDNQRTALSEWGFTAPEHTEEVKEIINDRVAQIFPARKYRTKKKATQAAEISHAVANIDHLSIITGEPFENAMTLYKNETAYLQNFKSMDNLTFKDGRIYFEGSALTPLTMAEVRNLQTGENIDKIDIPFLQALYSIILKEFERNNWEIQDTVSVYLPDMAKMFGLPNAKTSQDRMINSLSAHQTLAGFVKGGYKNPSIYPLLLFEGYNADTNTVTFSSPYINNIIRQILQAAQRTDRSGNPQFKKNGQPLLKPSYSYLVKSSIAKEKNKAAVQNVFIIIRVIEQAGTKGTPHISAATLINQNTLLKHQLENAQSKHKSQLLKRVFSKTWQLLREQTELTTTYRDIQLPDENEPKNIPTAGNLAEVVFQFPHSGKIRGA